MVRKPYISLLMSLALILGFAYELYSQKSFEDKHIEVAMRKIGHEVLLHAKDSTTRVLPVLKEDDQYIIRFEADFGFRPDDLLNTVSTVIEEANIAPRYIVEVKECQSELVVYSFEMDYTGSQDIVPCRSRMQPPSCYQLVFTILEQQQNMLADPGTAAIRPPFTLITGLLSLIVVVGFVVWKRRNHTGKSELIRLGKYLLDERNSMLILHDQKTELSGKEVDLLSLLYSSANTTVKKETILNKVWGDEGSYVGRTLDVFISKLRAKLQEDPEIRIVNIRGVGYKLVVNE